MSGASGLCPERSGGDGTRLLAPAAQHPDRRPARRGARPRRRL